MKAIPQQPARRVVLLQLWYRFPPGKTVCGRVGGYRRFAAETLLGSTSALL